MPVCVRVIRVFAQDVWQADASDRAGDVCSRKPLAFDEGRRGRGWRVRAAVASPHRVTAAISFCPSVPPQFCVLFCVVVLRGFAGVGLF